MVKNMNVSMHLLVLSTFRLRLILFLRCCIMSQCTFWCSVLSDSSTVHQWFSRQVGLNAPFGAQCFPTRDGCLTAGSARSQCTFWCSVLSDGTDYPVEEVCPGLNAPFGAQCFPTKHPREEKEGIRLSQCTFWCSVLSDINTLLKNIHTGTSQCTFWCSVLSDESGTRGRSGPAGSLNAPFGAQCFPTENNKPFIATMGVSMHLLVLSAFRP